MGRVKKELTGQKFGKLLVISFVEVRSGAYWLCSCDCGSLKEVRSSHLISGEISSCGCNKKKYENLSGNQFGRLNVISESHYKNREHFWKCVCSCGKKIVVGGNWLRSGNTKSCGCYQAELTTKRSTKHGLCVNKRKRKYIPEYEKYLRQRPEYVLRKNISCQIRKGLKNNGSGKNKRSVWNFLPYTSEELKIHLESLMEPWMTWNNYGSCWHIDHIEPQSNFSYISMDDIDFQLCWSLSNLRPLKAIDNLKKSNKCLSYL
jgi:hypothetical protein